MTVFLTGPRKIADLRLLEMSDLPEITKGVNNVEIQRYMGMRAGPVTEQFERTWLERVIEPSRTDIVFGVIVRSTGELAGSMGLHQIDTQNGTAGTGAYFWNTNCHSKGIGTDAKFALLHWAFMAKPLRKITSTVLSNNPRSKHYQEKTAYREVGRRKEQFFRDGKYVDEIFMEVFRNEFMVAYEAYA